MGQKTQYPYDVTPPKKKLTYRFSTITIRIPGGFLLETDKLTLTFTGNV